jgi:hypothetical protein
MEGRGRDRGRSRGKEGQRREGRDRGREAGKEGQRRTNLSPSNSNSNRLLDSSFIISKRVLIRAMSREPEKKFTRLAQR